MKDSFSSKHFLHCHHLSIKLKIENLINIFFISLFSFWECIWEILLDVYGYRNIAKGLKIMKHCKLFEDRKKNWISSVLLRNIVNCLEIGRKTGSPQCDCCALLYCTHPTQMGGINCQRWWGPFPSFSPYLRKHFVQHFAKTSHGKTSALPPQPFPLGHW